MTATDRQSLRSSWLGILILSWGTSLISVFGPGRGQDSEVHGCQLWFDNSHDSDSSGRIRCAPQDSGEF